MKAEKQHQVIMTWWCGVIIQEKSRQLSKYKAMGNSKYLVP